MGWLDIKYFVTKPTNNWDVFLMGVISQDVSFGEKTLQLAKNVVLAESRKIPSSQFKVWITLIEECMVPEFYE